MDIADERIEQPIRAVFIYECFLADNKSEKLTPPY
jgi:hypothetical protein